MGRKKIKIQPIKEDRNRSVTYLKRKAGLFKKAHELAVLTDSQVAVIVFGHNGKLAEFCSTDIDLLLLRYTEYDGVSERKGPQHYHGLDKDSEDEEDDADDDADGPSNPRLNTDDPADDSGSGSAGRGGNSGGNNGGTSSGRRSGGSKRKAEPASPSSSSKQNKSNAHTDAQDATPTSTKQVVQAALRQKSDPLSNSGQQLSSMAWHNQHALASSHMHPGYRGPLPHSAVSPTVNPMRASMIAGMSIVMPPSADRVPVFVMPATPGTTPGGSVTTPGGRRSSFSDIMLRSQNSVTMTRPLTANALLTPSFLQMQEQYGMASTPSFDFLDESHQHTSGQAASYSDAITHGEYTTDAATPRASDFDPRQNSQSRPASTSVQKNSETDSHSAVESPVRIVRPYTAAGYYASSNLPVSAFSAHSHQSMYGTQYPPSANGREAQDRQRGMTLSATPVPSLTRSATPDRASSSDAKGAAEQTKLGNLDKYAQPSVPSSNMSTDDDSPMGNSNFTQNYLDGTSDMPDGFQQWFEDQLSVQKTPQPAAIVQPVPVYAERQPVSEA